MVKMVLLKTSVALLLVAVAFATVPPTAEKPKSAEKHVAAPEPIYNISTPTETNTTSVQPPTKVTTEAPPKSTTSIPTTSSLAPNVTTVAPNVTTSTTTPTTSKPTTIIPPGPSTSTAAPTPAPEPTPARSWDGSSFLGGMVLAFGIIAVGFVGFKFFHLARGGAYHTL